MGIQFARSCAWNLLLLALLMGARVEAAPVVRIGPAAGGLEISASGAEAGAPFTVLTATELGGDPGSWATLTTGTTDGEGAFTVVTALGSGEVRRFYVVRFDGAPVVWQVLQAEDGIFTGIVDTIHEGYTGSGFVDTTNAAGSYLELEFGRAEEGTITVLVRYAHGKTDDRSAVVTVNGVVTHPSQAFPPTGAWTTWETVSLDIPVQAGRNVLRLTALTAAGLANIDKLEATGAPQYPLTLTVTGSGSISADPAGAGGYYSPGTTVELTAVPDAGAQFTGWGDDLTGMDNPATLVITGPASVVAGFINLGANTYFVAIDGSDTNPGTLAAPLRTLPAALARAAPGDVIYLRGGTHAYTQTINLTGNNPASQPILIAAYPGETPVLDWSAWQPSSAERGNARGFKITGSYWHLRGFEIAHAPDNGVKCEGHHITFERLVFRHNGDSGIQIGLGSTSVNSSPDTMAAHNLVLNCDSYGNVDPATAYENADGFACKLYAGRGNVFRGCRAWENCDDGWDLYQTDYEVVLEDCWSWHNGDPAMWGFTSFNGDGNAFKLGGDFTYCPVTVIRCVALDTQWGTKVGFAYNNNTAPATLINCSAINCGRSYKFAQPDNLLQNCLQWNITTPAPADLSATTTQVANSWNLPVTVTAADFASVSAADAGAPRQPDGSLPDNGFGRLVSGSDLIDKGVDTGLPYAGAAPDLGAFESGL